MTASVTLLSLTEEDESSLSRSNGGPGSASTSVLSKAHSIASETEKLQHNENTVPKFTSFRPKPPSSSQSAEKAERETPNSGLRSDGRPRDNAPTASSQRGHSSSKHHSRNAHESRVRRHADRHATPGSPERTPEPRVHESKTFVVDRSGDPKNLTFGTLDRHAVPRYSRFGSGNVVGILDGRKLDRYNSSEKEVVLSLRRDYLQNAQEMAALWKSAQQESQELSIRPQNHGHLDIESEADFVFLTVPRPIKRRRRNDGSSVDISSSEEDTYRYRSTDGEAKGGNGPADRDLHFSADKASPENEGDHYHSFSDSMRQKRALLSQQVDKKPEDAGAWLELIDHQDRITGFGKDSSKNGLTNAERISNADIKTSLYEKALDNVKNPQGQEALLLGLMHEASSVWDDQKLSLKWKSVLRQNPGFLRLWITYLDFRQTDFSSFKFEHAQNVYLECLGILSEARLENACAVEENNKLYEIQIYILLRLALLMREAGFTEYAVSVWQALLEFEYFRPTHLRLHGHNANGPSQRDVVSAFEDFWDSEVPRIGEDGAEGWASFCQKRGDPPEPKTDATDEVVDVSDLFASWEVSERSRTMLSRQPARAIDEVEEDDPYRVILFSDIQPYLLEAPTSTSAEILMQGFLAFCHLPPFRSDIASSTRDWFRDGFVRNEMMRSSATAPKPHAASDTDGIQQEHRQRDSPFGFHSPDYQVASDTMFAAAGSWFSIFDAWKNECDEDRGPMKLAWVLHALKSLVNASVGGDDLSQYFLALELGVSPGTVKKTARNLLKSRPSSLLLYNAYALTEYRQGRSSKGENVIITAINMSKQLDEVAKRDSILLWRTWLWELLSTDKTQEAFRRLLNFTDESIPAEIDMTVGHETNLALVLRTERALTSTRDHMLSLHSHSHATLAAESLILLTYLRNPNSLSAATLSFRTNLTLLKNSSDPNIPSQEYLHQSFAHLIHHHATHTRLVKPSTTRSLLADSIAEFPQNTIFLSLYAWNESRFRIDDRVRSFSRDVVLGNGPHDSKSTESVISHFFAIHTELHRGTTFGSNTNAIRAAFERAVVSEVGRHCAGLWKMHFLFEEGRGDMKKAKEVFYRGLRACPWVKGLYMLAFEYLQGAGGLGQGELRGVYGMMIEKELRVHIDLEEWIETRDNGV